MTVAGFCRQCNQYVYLNDQWGCVNGHAWTELSKWYDPQTGAAVTPYWLQPNAAQETGAPAPEAPAEGPASVVAPAVAPVVAPVVAPAPPSPASPAAQPAPPSPPPPAAQPAPPSAGTRDALLTDLMATFAQYPGYRLAYGTDTDVTIDNQVADANWGTGKKKIEYEAILKAVEPERTVYFWEMLKEKGGGVSFGGFEGETYATMGGTRWGKKKEAVIGPGGVAMNVEWDYAATRRIVEDVAARNGFKVKVVLRKKAAQW